MKNALFKDTIREIKKTFGRFISIFGIVLVGVAFFVGVKASAPYMKRSADAYLTGKICLTLRYILRWVFRMKMSKMSEIPME